MVYKNNNMRLESTESSLSYPIFSPVGRFKNWFTSLGSALITAWVVISIGACKNNWESIGLVVFLNILLGRILNFPMRSHHLQGLKTLLPEGDGQWKINSNKQTKHKMVLYLVICFWGSGYSYTHLSRLLFWDNRAPYKGSESIVLLEITHTLFLLFVCILWYVEW